MPTPPFEDKRVLRFRERFLHHSTILAFAVAALLLLLAGLPVAVLGPRRLALESHVLASAASSAGLIAACSGLSAAMHREDRVGVIYRLAVWGAFGALCGLGVLVLVIVVGNIEV